MIITFFQIFQYIYPTIITIKFLAILLDLFMNNFQCVMEIIYKVLIIL
jgi:hypothetical protein